MTKTLFAFIDGSQIDSYLALGFSIDRDGEEYVAEMDLSDYDNLAVLAVLEDCLVHNDIKLSVALNYNGKLLNDEEALAFMDKIAAGAPLEI